MEFVSAPVSPILRAIVAAVVGALAFGMGGAVAIMTWAAVSLGAPLGELPGNLRGGLRLGLRLGFSVGLPGALTLGLATHAGLQRLRWTTWRVYAVAGAIIGLAGAGIFVGSGGFDFSRRAGPAEYALWGAIGAFAGLCGGVAFWRVSRPPATASSSTSSSNPMFPGAPPCA